MDNVDRLAFQRKLDGWRLATAEILYHLPDHPSVLQTFIWQHLDLAPKFPELKRFLAFWEKNLEGPIHSVRVCRSKLLSAEEFRSADGQFFMH
jgi:uncharacterized protein Usg